MLRKVVKEVEDTVVKRRKEELNNALAALSMAKANLRRELLYCFSCGELRW